MKQTLYAWASIVVGCTILAAGFVFFINPYNIVPGGVYGASIVLHNLFPSIQVGTFGYMFDIPLLILSVLLFFGGLFHLDRGYGGAVNLEPFHTIRNYIIYYRRTGSFVSVTNLLGNVVILVPLGVLMPVMFRPMRHFWTFLPLAALVSCGVEYIQWVTATGAADVDDSILNFIGAALGYLFTRLCQITAGMIAKRRSRGE